MNGLEQQITVDALLGRVGHYVNSRESLSARDVETLRELFEFFATQQRADATQQLQRENDRAMREASHLAMSIWRTHYQKESPNFELCDSVAGVISQIDNMYAGLRAELAAAKQQLAESENREISRLDYNELFNAISSSVKIQGDAISISVIAFRNAIDAARTAQAGDVTPVCPHLRRTTQKSIVDRGVERDRCVDCGLERDRCVDCGEVLLTGVQAVGEARWQ